MKVWQPNITSTICGQLYLILDSAQLKFAEFIILVVKWQNQEKDCIEFFEFLHPLWPVLRENYDDNVFFYKPSYNLYLHVVYMSFFY